MEAATYRARRPAETPLYALLESLYETVKGAWEDLFECRYGFWRGLLDGVVARYLDCGIFERGFARQPRPPALLIPLPASAASSDPPQATRSSLVSATTRQAEAPLTLLKNGPRKSSVAP